MLFNIIFKTIFEYIHKKFRFMHTNTFCKYRKNYSHRLACILLVVFFFTEKNYLMSSLAMSVRPSVRPSVCPSSVEISLERGCSITNMPIDLKFGPIIGSRVMHV